MGRRRRDRPGGCCGCLGTLLLAALVLAVVDEVAGTSEEAVRGAWTLFFALVAAAAGFFALRRALRARRRAAARRQLLGCSLDDLDRLPGLEFEKWIAARLEADGFRCEDLRASGDFGVDVIAEKRGVRIGIQAKRMSSNVGNAAVQEAIAGSDYYRCDVPAVVTQSHFTRAAKAQAGTGRTRVVLIERSSLTSMGRIFDRVVDEVAASR